MNYTEQYQLLKNSFDPEKEKIEFPGSAISCHMLAFESKDELPELFRSLPDTHSDDPWMDCKDDHIKENSCFKYPVFLPATQEKYDHAIILLHGLNERSWIKYLVWAYYLVEQTGRPVILFPIAFHMNRSPKSWGNPRLMTGLMNLRRSRLGEVPVSTFANVALSERLTSKPIRFYASGRQSAMDLLRLSRQLYSGEHAFFKPGTQIDFFSYSIGAFLSQILFIANPDELFSRSKLFLFCGGAFFDEMNGISKLIMDQPAFRSLREYYLLNFRKEVGNSGPLAESLYQTGLGNAFLAMLADSNLKKYRDERLNAIGNRVFALTLEKDQVIPARSVYSTLKPFSRVEVVDLAYPYSHEVPFPVSMNDAKNVDASFHSIFSKAAAFLC